MNRKLSSGNYNAGKPIQKMNKNNKKNCVHYPNDIDAVTIFHELELNGVYYF